MIFYEKHIFCRNFFHGHSITFSKIEMEMRRMTKQYEEKVNREAQEIAESFERVIGDSQNQGSPSDVHFITQRMGEVDLNVNHEISENIGNSF